MASAVVPDVLLFTVNHADVYVIAVDQVEGEGSFNVLETTAFPARVSCIYMG